jgi:hypothetical protein
MGKKFIIPNNEEADEREYQRLIKDKVKEYLNINTIEEFPDLWDILEEDFYNKYIKKVAGNLEQIYYHYHSQYNYYGILEKDAYGQFAEYFIECIYKKIIKEYDYDIILENEEYLNKVYETIHT